MNVFVTGVKESSSGVVTVELSNGSVVYTRQQYLQTKLTKDRLISEILIDELYFAERCFSAECKAISLLNYAENTRLMIFQKLSKKGFVKTEITPALDYLEAQNILSDSRFAKCWVRSRLKNKAEGKSVLLAKLMTKGVSFNLAKATIDQAFQNVDETELCRRAIEKQLSKNIDTAKIFTRVQALGFSYSTIKTNLLEIQK